MLQGKKLLVTGATGEVARAIATSYARDNEVWAAARFSDPAARARLDESGIRTHAWSLGSDDFSGLPADFDYVIHAAATVLPVANDYDAAVRENAEGTGLLMRHVRAAKAFLYVSSMGIYAETEDGAAVRSENSPIGSHPFFAPSYGVSKVSAEAVVRTLARIYNLPSIIARLGMNYGIGCSGVPDFIFRMMLAGEQIPLPFPGRSFASLIHNSEVVAQVEPLLAAASVPATIVNWTGDEAVDEREMYQYLAEIGGLTPNFVEREDAGYQGGIADTSRRRSITGPSRYAWRTSFVEMLRANYPDHPFPGQS